MPQKQTRTKTPAKKTPIKKGVGAVLQPGATLAAVTTNLPDTAISVAAQLNQFNSLQPLQCYEMSVPCRKAVDAIVGEASRCEVRFFTRDGDEVLDGEPVRLLKRPAPNWSTRRFLNDIMSFDLVSGEIAISLMLDGGTGRPCGMLPLAPNRLYPIDPTTPNELNDIRLWQYTYQSGMIGQLRNSDSLGLFPRVQLPAECVIFAPNFNTSSHIRGLSKFVTGVDAASVSYQALRYKKDFFTNGAVPSHIIVLQEGLSEKQRKDWEQRYLEQYSTFNNQSQKIIVSSGTDLEVRKLENEMKDDQMIELLRYSDQQIAMLFSVPPTIMGLWDKVRFETAAIERTQFLESTVLPLITTVQDVLQFQLIDRFFGLSKITRGKPRPMKKSFKRLLEKKLDENTSSEYLIVLDPSTIPLMSQINIDQFNALDVLCTKGRMSPNEAADWLQIDIPYNPLRDKIFISSTLQELTENMSDTAPKPIDDQTNEVVAEETEHSNDPSHRTMDEVDEDEKLDDEETKTKVKALHNLYRSIRKHVLINNEKGSVYSLSEVDQMCSSMYTQIPLLKKELRKDRFTLKALLKDKSPEERAKAIRNFYNGKKTAHLRSLV